MRIIFGGDTVPTEATMDAFIRGDGEAIFGKMLPILKSADRLIVNLECALTESDDAIIKCGPNIKADPRCTTGLLAIGVTDVCLSNNHTLDFGEQGLRDTMRYLDEAGIPYTGVGEDDTDSRKLHIIEQDGVKIGIVNVCEHEYSYALSDRFGANPYDPYLTMQDIRAAKAECDYVAVCYHGGKEHCRYPSPRVYNLAHEMVYCGADLVLVQHTHCVGAYENFEGGHIVYGQGNFNFPWLDRECWKTALAVEVDPTDKSKIIFYPLLECGSGVDLAEGEVAAEIINGFKERSDSLLDGSWIEGWREFCLSPECDYIREIPYKIIEKESLEGNIAHRIDCEAHLDVMMEVYKTSHRTGTRQFLDHERVLDIVKAKLSE